MVGGDPQRVVLAVEDDVLVRIFVADVLADAGYRVLEASSATEALTVLRARPDVLVMVTDVDMPGGMNGFALARAVRKQHANIQIIVMSGRTWPQADDLPIGSVFIGKPVTGARLAGEVGEAVARAESLLGNAITIGGADSDDAVA